jgi:hypothetical protein
MTVHQLKLKDLTALFFQQLRQQYLDGEMEVEVRVLPKAANRNGEQTMTEDEFWKIIALLDWEKEGDDDAVLQPAVAYVSAFPVSEIARFQDILSEKLHRLDGEQYARHTGENAFGEGNHFSADIFLYARCCAVANGRIFYEQVLTHPEDMPKDLDFEALLSLAGEACLKKTGKHLDHVPAYNYETGFNSQGWGEKTIRL